MSLDITKEVSELHNMYKERKQSRMISALVIGKSGSGKTRLLETCPRPIHVDSFDPNGLTTIKRGIEERWIIPDTRYEDEDPTDPYAFELWDETYHKRKASGYFNQIGTYALDGITGFIDAAMNIVLKGLVRKADRATKAAIKSDLLRIPQENDWPLQMNMVMNALRDILTLPCNVVVIGHVEDKTNKQGQVTDKGLFITGKLRLRVPRMFEEIYYMKVEESSKGPVYIMYTQSQDGIEARTRIGRDKFDFREEPNIMKLLTKAGLNPQHKDMPWLNNNKEEESK